jgi:hypothetical protein
MFLYSEAKVIRPVRVRREGFGGEAPRTPPSTSRSTSLDKYGQIRGGHIIPLRTSGMPFIGTDKLLILEYYFAVIAFHT